MPKYHDFDIFNKNTFEFPGLQICDKNNLSTRAYHLNNFNFESEYMEIESGASFLAISIEKCDILLNRTNLAHITIVFKKKSCYMKQQNHSSESARQLTQNATEI